MSFDPCIPAVARSASGHGVELMSEISRVVVNGVEYEIGVAGDRRLLDWLREDLGLTGAKYGCGEAACGACSVMIDGALARACVVATGDVVGRSVTTIEGLARNGELHPVQHAFVHVDAMQCGFCTPGMVIAAVALLNVHPHPSDDEITHWMVPNLCRPARLGRRVAPASFLAHDQFGRDLLVSLRGDGVNTSLVHVDNPPETDRSFVLWYGSDRTILVRHQSFNYHWPHLRPSDVPAWIFLTSVRRNSLAYEDQVADWIEANASVRLAFRPGTPELEAGTERLSKLCARSELLIVTENDARALVGRGVGGPGDLVGELLALGPLRIVLTDRNGGAHADHRYSVPPYPDTSPAYDRTGVDVAIEAVGVRESFELCTKLVRPGRSRGEDRRPRQAGDTAPRVAVDPRRHRDDRARRHPVDDAPAPGRRSPDRGGQVPNPPHWAERHPRDLRRLPARVGYRRGEGGPGPMRGPAASGLGPVPPARTTRLRATT